MTRTPIDDARDLYELCGLLPIPVPRGEKGPKVKGWPDLRITTPELFARYFGGEPVNIGVLLGAPSGNIIDVDLDHPLAVELADEYLPFTDCVWGRASKPRSHRLYKMPAEVPTKKWRTVGGASIVELRSTGHQTIAPGSVHPSGEPIRWHEMSDGVATPTDPDALRAALTRLANAVRERLGEPAIDDEGKRESPPATLAGSNGHHPPAPTLPRIAGSGDGQAAMNSPYARAALDQECAAVAGTAEGGRNDRLNLAAFRLGTLVGAGVLDAGEVGSRLRDAAAACGLSRVEASRTIGGGVKAGTAHPRGEPTGGWGGGAGELVDWAAVERQIMEAGGRVPPNPSTRAVENVAGESAGAGGGVVKDSLTTAAPTVKESLTVQHRLGSVDPTTGRLILSPRVTLPTALAYVRQFHAHPDRCTITYRAGAFMAWAGGVYVEQEEADVRARLFPWLHAALARVRTKKGEIMLVDFESNPNAVGAAVQSVKDHVATPAEHAPPCWLGDSGAGKPDPKMLIPFRSGTLNPATGEVYPPTPHLFNVNALDFDYDPAAPRPARWLAFLKEIWGEDYESINTLQEWFGYCLTGDTRQQKMALIVGPRRSGKGTIARVLTSLVGASNVAGPTTGSLAGAFGLQPLVYASLAIVSDARFAGRDAAVVTERLLCISGEDSLTIDRKHKESITLKLPTRMMFLTNELPRLGDSSTALPGRFIILKLAKSFYGLEDTGLTASLLAELPGILLWAIDGWKRLQARGRFVQPSSSADAVEDMEDLASPVGAFVRERCVVGVGQSAWVDDLYAAYKKWCEDEGRDWVGNKASLGRDLVAVVPSLTRQRSRTAVARAGHFYLGIGVKT